MKKIVGILLVLVMLGSIATAMALTANKESEKSTELKLPRTNKRGFAKAL